MLIVHSTASVRVGEYEKPNLYFTYSTAKCKISDFFKTISNFFNPIPRSIQKNIF